MKDRPTRCHRIAGGAGGGGDDQSITAVLIHHFSVDLKLQHAGGGDLVESGAEVKIVESAVNRIAAIGAGLKHHASLEGEAVVAQALPKIEPIGLSAAAIAKQLAFVGQKPEMAAHVEAQDRHPKWRHVPRRTQHRAIATKHHGEIGRPAFISQQTWKGIGMRATHGHGHPYPLGAELFSAAASLAKRCLARRAMNQPNGVQLHGREAESAAGRLPTQQIEALHVHRLAVAIKGQENRQTHCSFSSSNGDHEDGEHLASNQLAIEIAGECHQVDVHSIEHQFNAHQHPNSVAAIDQTPDTSAEQNGCQSQVGLKGDSGW